MLKVTQIRVEQGFKSRHLKGQRFQPYTTCLHQEQGKQISPQHKNKQLIVKIPGNEINSRRDTSSKKNMKNLSII